MHNINTKKVLPISLYQIKFLTKMESDIEAIFSNNSKQLRKLFEALHPVNQKISVQEFLIFCKNVRIHPVITKQELLSINDIKKLVQDLTAKGISFGNLQSLLRLLAEQAFTSTPSVSDKLRMLFIHIRSPCKLFYQVSLNFNIQDSASEELEVDQMDFDKLKCIKTAEDFSQKIIRNRYFTKSPDTIVAEKSPKSALINTFRKEPPKSATDRSAAIKEKLEKFRQVHKSIVENNPTVQTSKKIAKRREYIFRMNQKIFPPKIVLRVLFNAWKALKLKRIQTSSAFNKVSKFNKQF